MIEKLLIHGVDEELLEKQRKQLNHLNDRLRQLHAIRLTPAEIEMLIGLENMLDAWSDKRHHDDQVAAEIEITKDSPLTDMLLTPEGTCHVCGNDDDDLKPTLYGSMVGHLPTAWQDVMVPMCRDCRNPHTAIDLRGATDDEIAQARSEFQIHELNPENCPVCARSVKGSTANFELTSDEYDVVRESLDALQESYEDGDYSTFDEAVGAGDTRAITLSGLIARFPYDHGS